MAGIQTHKKLCDSRNERRCKRAYLEDVIKLTRKQPRRLWSEPNRVMGRHTQSTVQHIQTDEGDLYDSQGIAMAFNEHFFIRFNRWLMILVLALVLVQVLILQHCLSL